MDLVRRPLLPLILALALAASACTGSGSESAAVTPEPQADVATPTPTQVPTPEMPEPSDEAKIAAAVAAFEADPRPAGLIAYDYLDTRLRGTTGVVDLEICGWEEDTVFDKIYVVAYRLRTADDGTVAATFETVNSSGADCVNTELVESALQATRDYENYWRPVAADPATFDIAEAEKYLTTEALFLAEPVVVARAAEGISFRNTFLDGALPDSAVTDVLGRTYALEGFEIFELLACRTIPDGFGLYRGDTLIDDFRGESSAGTEGLIQYSFIRRDQKWLILGIEETGWVDCTGFGSNWVDGVNETIPDPVPWASVFAA